MKTMGFGHILLTRAVSPEECIHYVLNLPVSHDLHRVRLTGSAAKERQGSPIFPSRLAKKKSQVF